MTAYSIRNLLRLHVCLKPAINRLICDRGSIQGSCPNRKGARQTGRLSASEGLRGDTPARLRFTQDDLDIHAHAADENYPRTFADIARFFDFHIFIQDHGNQFDLSHVQRLPCRGQAGVPSLLVSLRNNNQRMDLLALRVVSPRFSHRIALRRGLHRVDDRIE